MSHCNHREYEDNPRYIGKKKSSHVIIILILNRCATRIRVYFLCLMDRFRPYIIMSMYLAVAFVFAYIIDVVYVQAAGTGSLLQQFCQ